MTNSIKRCCIASFALIVASSVSPIRAVCAQTSPKSASSQNLPLRDIKSAFRSVAERASVTLVVEGEPYKTTLTSAEIGAIDQTGSPEALIEQVANAYDYEARVQTGRDKGNIYVLKKRYTNVDDLPFVTLAEMRAVCEDMQHMAAALEAASGLSRIDKKPNVAVAAFAASLSHEQLALMQDKTRGIPVQSLNTQQHDQLLSVPVKAFLGDTQDSLFYGVNEARLVTDSSATIGKIKNQTTTEFGYEGPLPLGNNTATRVFRALNGAYNPLPTPFVFPTNSDSSTRPITSLSASSNQTPLLSETLARAAGSVQSRSGDAFSVVVDDELSSKPVWAVNTSVASPEALLRGLSAVYGLRLTTKADGSRHIGRFVPKPRSLAELPAALTQLLPDPFLRVMRWRTVDLADASSDFAARPDALRPQTPLRVDLTKRTLEVRAAATAFLKASIEPKLENKVGSMAIGSMNAAEQSALADVILSFLWEAVRNKVVYPVPAYVTHFEDGIVTGGYANYKSPSDTSGTKEKDGFSVHFYYRDAQGKLKDSGVEYMTNLRYAK